MCQEMDVRAAIVIQLGAMVQDLTQLVTDSLDSVSVNLELLGESLTIITTRYEF